MITAVATFNALRNIEKTAQQDFLVRCGEIRTAIANRLEDHARILRSSAAFLNALDTVTRERWRIFHNEQSIDKQLPGIQGIGFALLIPRDALAGHIAGIRAEGFPGYTVRPDGDRDTYSSIIYLEPFTGRNLRAFGYDMFSEPIRRKAMEQARDTAAAALSGKVILVQETDKDVQAGTLMYVPVYRKGLPTDSVDARRAALYGWVYSPYRMNDLMRGILGTRFQGKDQHFALKIFDGDTLQPQNLLLEDGLAVRGSAGARFTHLDLVDFKGQRWTLSFTQTGDGMLSAEYGIVWLTLACGLLLSVLLSFLIMALINTRAAALKIAEELTRDLSQSEAVLRQTTTRLTLATRAGGVGVWDFDLLKNSLSWDNEMYRLYGITAGQFNGAYEAWQSGLHPDDRARGDEEIQRALRGEQEFDTAFRVVWPDGTIRNIRALAVVQRDASGRPQHMIGTNWDITRQKNNEEQ